MDFRRLTFAFGRRHAIVLGVLLVFATGVILFDWNWLRGPLVNYLAERSGREVRIGHLHVRLGWLIEPTVQLRGVYRECVVGIAPTLGSRGRGGIHNLGENAVVE